MKHYLIGFDSAETFRHESYEIISDREIKVRDRVFIGEPFLEMVTVKAIIYVW